MPKGEYARPERTFLSHYAIEAEIVRRFRMLRTGNLNAASSLLIKLQNIVREPRG